MQYKFEGIGKPRLYRLLKKWGGESMKRTITILLAVALILCVPGAALAADASSDAIMRPMYSYIGFASSTLNISSSGYATMEAAMSCAPPVNKIRIAEYLQRYENGSWQTVANWAQYYYDDLALWSKGYYVPHGYQYRLHCYFYCYYDPNLLETTTVDDYYNFY
jgi:hypothetical protein